MLTFLEVTFVTFLMYALIKVRFHLYANTTLVFKKRIQACRLQNFRKAIIQANNFFYASVFVCLSTNVAFERDSMSNITFLPCWRSGKKQLTPKIFLLLYLLITQMHSIVCCMILLLLNSMLMD